MNDKLTEQMARVYGPVGVDHDAQRGQLLAALPTSQPQQTHTLWRHARRLLIGEQTMTRTRILVRLASSAAVVGLLILGGFLLTRAAAPEVAFAEVMQNMSELRSFHAELIVDGKRTEFWAAQPGQLRIDHPNGKYEISSGPDLWVVEPEANRATHRPSHYQDMAVRHGMDMAAVVTNLGFNQILSGFLAESPSERIQRDGLTLDVYRLGWTSHGYTMQGEVLVDVTARLLYSFHMTFDGEKLHREAVFTLLDCDQAPDESLFVFAPAPDMKVKEEPSKHWWVARQEEALASGEGSTLSGRIIWAESGAPVFGARVRVWIQNDDPFGAKGKYIPAHTDRDGRWTVAGIQAGPVRLKVRAWEFGWPTVPMFEATIGSDELAEITVDGTSTYDGLDFEVRKPD